MRIVFAALFLIALFILLLQVVPPAAYLPLYLLFTVVGIAYFLRERRRLAERRQTLEEELEQHEQAQIDWAARLSERFGPPGVIAEEEE